MSAYLVDTELVHGSRAKARYQWLRALFLRLGYLTYQSIIEATLRAPSSPFYELLMGPSTQQHVFASQKMKLRSAVRGLLFSPSIGPVDERFRVFVSADVAGALRLVPSPYLVRTPELMQANDARAAQFERSWSQHRINMNALAALRQNQRYWKRQVQ